MGLAASQAKLLSITARISDNELRSQSITAAKMSLANQTSAASKKYLDALNSTEYIYRTYDADGDKVFVPLTGMQLSKYGPLKNQYCLVNSAGQILVSELDGANYEASADINEFLEKYNIDKIDTGETKTVVNEAYAEAQERYEGEYAKWLSEEPAKYIQQMVKPAWDEVIPGETTIIEEAWTEVIPAYTERKETTGWWNRILQTGCIDYTMSGYNCWMHVVSSLLGEGDHTTSSGIPFHVYDGACSEHNKTWCWNTDEHPVSNQLKADLHKEVACGHEHDEYVDMPLPDGGIYTAWCKDSTCTAGMTVYQKLVDLLWDCHGDYTIGSDTGGSSTPENVARFWHIVNFDLCKWEEIEHPEERIEHPAITDVGPEETIHHDAEYEEVENPAYQKWLESEPQMEDVPPTREETVYKYSDEDMAQWYVNLWHRMNGESQEKDGDTSTTNVTYETLSEYGQESSTERTKTTKTTYHKRYDILEDGLMNSQEWLKYALESCAVSLERVNYTNPTEDGTGLKFATWTSIIYTNALDISEQTNETKIAKAEAEYEQKQREIEAKDKQYDSMLKLLDTEHTALQTEVESVKAVITKNTERTLKIYSA